VFEQQVLEVGSDSKVPVHVYEQVQEAGNDSKVPVHVFEQQVLGVIQSSCIRV
jgi:hypothetical protein